jgi:COMPASS component BRE2
MEFNLQTPLLDRDSELPFQYNTKTLDLAMADGQSHPAALASPLSAIPPARRPEEDHTPTVSSPLNPARPAKPPAPAREQREKKESLKKRESTAAGRGNTPDAKSKAKAKAVSSVPSPMRFSIAEPKHTDYDPPKDIIFASHDPNPIYTPDGQAELKKPTDQ